jgi:ergothioneine biosynthesis protein EgtB
MTIQNASIKSSPDFDAVRYEQVRRQTGALCKPLSTEDYVVQSMPEVSPTKWHLAHTSWFFETFLLKPYHRSYQEFDPNFSYLFNSYYNAIGDRHCRQNRGLLSRPTVQEIYAYRAHVDEHMLGLPIDGDLADSGKALSLVELGLHHEQQHQELMLTDIKHVFWVNPLRPAYVTPRPAETAQDPGQRGPAGEATNAVAPRWTAVVGGLREIGHDGVGFAFDNECPRHQQYVAPFEIASKLVTNGEFKQFILEGGYRKPEYWLSLGWATVQAEQWHAPLYWLESGGEWQIHTLGGLRAIADDEPVCHVSFFEAEAFARWAGVRLPTEAEWEIAAGTVDPTQGAFVESGAFHPGVAENRPGLRQMFGEVWQWTSSAYSPYPRYCSGKGALGEYNGKFMCNQYVLRGGSVATPRTHIRRTYRNFFPPATRWQFSGIRVVRDL